MKTIKQSYTITVEDDGEKITMRRINDGFSPLELLGILEHVQLGIMQQMGGEIKPDVIKRKVIEKEKNNETN